MTSGKISQREFIALEKDLSLAITGGLNDVNVAEKAIEAARGLSGDHTVRRVWIGFHPLFEPL